MGDNSQTTNQNQKQFTNPWGPAVGPLTNLLTQVGSGGSLTNKQKAALQSLWSGAGSVPQMGNVATPAVSNLFNTQPQLGLLSDAYGKFSNTLAPFMTKDFTNPMSTPGMGAALSTMNEDITNQIKGQFGAAGRSFSPDEAKAEARGLSQGEGQLLTNTGLSLDQMQEAAANAMLTGAGSTASGMTNLPIASTMAGISGSQALPGIWMGPGSAKLSAADTGVQTPFTLAQTMAPLLMGLGGMGGSGTNTGTSTTVQPVNPWTTGLGAGLGIMSMIPSFAAMSDRRLKDDVERIGILYNGLPVYKFTYKHDPSDRIHVGVMAQDVEKSNPDAVIESRDLGIMGPSFKLVDYAKATEPTAMAA